MGSLANLGSAGSAQFPWPYPGGSISRGASFFRGLQPGDAQLASSDASDRAHSHGQLGPPGLSPVRWGAADDSTRAPSPGPLEELPASQRGEEPINAVFEAVFDAAFEVAFEAAFDDAFKAAFDESFSRPPLVPPVNRKPAPPGWTVEVSKTTIQRYYWHEATQTRQVERPYK